MRGLGVGKALLCLVVVVPFVVVRGTAFNGVDSCCGDLSFFTGGELSVSLTAVAGFIAAAVLGFRGLIVSACTSASSSIRSIDFRTLEVSIFDGDEGEGPVLPLSSSGFGSSIVRCRGLFCLVGGFA